MKYIVWYWCFLMLPLVGVAQETDYVIANNNQKLFGRVHSVDISVNKGRITFKQPGKLIKTYHPEDLQEWSKDGDVYIARERPGPNNKRVFMKRITQPDAAVVLYEITNAANLFRGPEYFLERNGRLTKVRFIGFRKQMLSYFSDHAEIVELLENREVKRRDILALVEEYNEIIAEKERAKSDESEDMESLERRQRFWNFDDLLLSTDEAAKKYMDALQSAVANLEDDRDKAIETSYRLGLAFFQQQQYDAAIPYLKEARKLILRERRQLSKAPLAEAMLAEIYYDKQKFQLAIGYNSNALEKWQKTPPSAANFPELYRSYVRQGRILQQIAPARSNLSWYQLGAPQGQKDWETELAARNLKAIRHSAQEQKSVDYNLALLNFNTAQKLIPRLPSSERDLQTIQLQLALGGLYFHAGSYPVAQLFYEEALQIINDKYQGNHPQRTTIERMLSEIYLANQLYQEALNYIDQAQHTQIGENIEINEALLRNIQNIPFPYELLNSIATKGIILYEQNRQNPSIAELKKVLAHYAIATELLFQLRNTYRIEGSRTKLGRITQKLSQHAVIVCNTLYEKTKEEAYLYDAFTYAELSKSAVLFEAVQELKSRQVAGIPKEQTVLENGLKVQISYLKEEVFYELQQGKKANQERIQALERQIQETTAKHSQLLQAIRRDYPRYYELKYNNKGVTIEELQAILSPDELFLEYVVTDSFVYVLAIGKSTIQSQFKKLDQSLSAVVKKLQYALKSNKSDLYAKYGYYLFQQVLQDLIPTLEGKRLIIAPDGELNYIPFGVLPVNEAVLQAHGPDIYKVAHYLIQDYAICYNYSASLFLLSKQPHNLQPTRAMSTWAPDFHTMEAIVRDAGIGDELLPLPGAQNEAQQIAKLFSSPAYIGQEASEWRFKNEAQQYAVLHIATHGVVNDADPMFSSLILRNENGEDGILHAYELYNMHLQADLAVLSACNSGMGRLKKGEGVASIARGFSYAGVPNIVMSTWAVSDWSTEVLMRSFYKNLKRGIPKDEALRLAKIDYLKSNADNPAFLAPFYWGGFVLSGNTAPIHALEQAGGLGWWWIAIGLGTLLALGGLARKFKR